MSVFFYLLVFRKGLDRGGSSCSITFVGLEISIHNNLFSLKNFQLMASPPTRINLLTASLFIVEVVSLTIRMYSLVWYSFANIRISKYIDALTGRPKDIRPQGIRRRKHDSSWVSDDRNLVYNLHPDLLIFSYVNTIQKSLDVRSRGCLLGNATPLGDIPVAMSAALTLRSLVGRSLRHLFPTLTYFGYRQSKLLLFISHPAGKHI